MLTRRDVLNAAPVETRLLLVSSNLVIRGHWGEITPTPPTPKWAKPLRIPNEPTTVERARSEWRREAAVT